MLPDSNSPFVAAQTNGSAPSPFQAAATNGVAHTNGAAATNGAAHANGSRARSPFGASAPSISLPEPKKVPEVPSSPFSAAEEVKTAVNSPFEAALVEPTEGFAAPEPAAVAAVAPQALVGMPSTPAVNGRRNDPFAAPAPSGSVGRVANFVLPSKKAQEAAEQPAPVMSTPDQVTPAFATSAVVNGETSQLVLRAIFGVDRELNREEILQRARTLSGVRNLHVVGQSEGAAMSSLRSSIQRMGFGDQTSLALTTSGGIVDFIEEPGTTLAVLHEGSYAAGVREALIIVARELARLG